VLTILNAKQQAGKSFLGVDGNHGNVRLQLWSVQTVQLRCPWFPGGTMPINLEQDKPQGILKIDE
jgi:hypothetical protein